MTSREIVERIDALRSQYHASLQELELLRGVVLKQNVKPGGRTPPSIVLDVVSAATTEYGVSRAERATRRFASCILLHDLTDLSLSGIARIVGYRDHTTVIHALRAGRERENVREVVARCLEALRGAA